MTTAGARLGTAYISIQPDFSRFQEKVGAKLATALSPATQKAGRNIGKDLARGVDQGGLRSALAPLLRHFDRFGDEAGKSISAKIGKGSKPAAGDMFGLAGAMGEVEKRTRSAGKTTSNFSSDMFGVNRAAKAMGRDLRSVSSQLSDFHTRASKVDRTASKLANGIRGLGSDFGSVVRHLRVGSGDFSGFNGAMSRVNRTFSFFGNILRTLKLPAFFSAIGLAAQALSALAAGAIATVSALGPLSGALVALPAAALAAAQAFGVLKLATAGIQDAVKAAFTAQARGGAQAVDTMRRQEDATEQVADAERSLADTHRQVQQAQEALTEARKDASRELEDMKLAAEGAHDAEQQSNLSLIQARRELAKTLRDPKASGLDIRFAEEAVDQARNDLQQTQVDSKRARQDFKDAHEKGVKGMPQVVAAKESLADANRSVAQAERELTKAVRDQSDAMKEQGAAANTLQEKLAMLPPAGREFAKFLISLKPRLDVLRQTAAKGLFPGATKGIKSALGNFKVFRGLVDGTASALGRLAAKAGRKLGSEVWGKDLTKVGNLNTRIIERMGQAGLNLGDALRSILVSAIPFLDWLSKSTEAFTGWIKQEAEAGRESGRLSGFFQETRQVMETLVPIFKGVGGALLNIGSAARPLGNEILDALGKSAEGWRRWTDSLGGQNRLRQYFTESKPAIFEIGRLARDVGKAFFELGKQQGVASLLRLVRTSLVPALRDAAGAMTGLLSGFLQRFEHLRKEGVPAFDAFVQTLAEHAGEAGAKIAKALATAFVNSDIWGKLAIGGWLFAKFGGGKAFESMGARFGRKFATAFLLAVLSVELAKQIKQIIEGEKLDAPDSEKFSQYLNEYFEVDTAKIVAPNRVKITTALGSLLFNSQTQKVIAASSEKLQGLVGKIPEEFITKFNRMDRLREVFRNNLAPLPKIGGKAGNDLKRSLFPKLDELTDRGGKKAEAFASRVGGAFNRMTGVASTAMELLGDNMGEMLRALGGKPPKINLKKALNSLPELKPLPSATPGRQRGGSVPGLAATVPGNSTGDRHTLALNGVPVAKVESREGIFVGNRNLMGALQDANAKVPRFQKGGAVKGGKGGLTEPHLMGPDGALRKLGQAAIHKVFEGAKGYLDKHKGAGSGLIADAGPLRQFNHRFPKHSLSELSGKTRFSEALVARIAAWAGLPGRLFGQIAHGESDFYPGIYGIDPGGTIGRGLWAITSGVGNDAMINRYGGPPEMFNPLINAKVAKEIYDAAGQTISPWYGTKFVTGMAAGGLLRMAAGGALQTASRHRGFDPEGRKSKFAGLLRRTSTGAVKGTAARAVAWARNNLGTQQGSAKQERWGPDPWCGYFFGADMSAQGVPLPPNPGSTSSYEREWADGSDPVGGLGSASPGDFLGFNGEHTALYEGAGKMISGNWGDEVAEASVGDESEPLTSVRRPRYPGGTGTAAPGEEAGSAPTKETVPHEYAGAKTGPLDFGPMPKNLDAVERAINKLQGLMPTYRKAKRQAEKKGKPETAQAIGKNISAIEQRLTGLRSLRTRLKLEKARKALGKRMKKALSRFEGYGQIIEGSKLAYEKAAQDAEQVVALEPLSPEPPASATDQQREAAEKQYAEHTFPDYVEGTERPAYMQALEKVAAWRNDILKAERFGFGKGKPSVVDSETTWEAEDRQARNRIKQIKDFTDAVAERVAKFRHDHKGKALPDWLKKQTADRDQMRQELPFLQMRDGKLTELVTKARELFFPGGDKRLVPPPTPLPGSGELEEQLKDVQGIHPWPEQHELLGGSDLAPPRQAGRSGGVIFDLQGTIEELGLKIKQGLNGLGGGSGGGTGEDNSERTSLLEELLRQANQRELLGEIERKIFAQFPPYAGKAHTGAIVPGPSSAERTMIVKGGEGIFTREQGEWLGSAISGASGQTAGAPEVNLHLHIDKGAGVDASKIRAEIEGERGKRERQDVRGARRGMATAGWR